jgi:protocatechuate 3,4-dioxygenase beta subunit
MRNLLAVLLSLCVYLLACRPVESREPIVGLPCEGCSAVFEGLPANLSSRARIAPAGEPGRPLVVQGVVYGANGKPRPGVVIYAYQTNKDGVYPDDAQAPGEAAARHGRLRGWVVTDNQGAYAFDTIRPGGYPGTREPEHIHMHVIERGCATYYIDEILFSDDPRLTSERRRRLPERGGNGVVTPTESEGRWEVRRDIYLGKNVPGYPGCG